MSIYGTGWVCDADEHADTCERWIPCDCGDPYRVHWRWRSNHDRHWVYDPDIPCTCLCGPIVYRGSHVVPSDGDERGGALTFVEIPGHITRDWKDDGPDDGSVLPWLCMTVDVDDVQDLVLDRDKVQALAEYLVGWLRRSAPSGGTRRLSREER